MRLSSNFNNMWMIQYIRFLERLSWINISRQNGRLHILLFSIVYILQIEISVTHCSVLLLYDIEHDAQLRE